MKNIISASRRTDIPAFYTDWFINRLNEGYVYVKNPYGRQVVKVSLHGDDIHSIVFWSKNFSPLISRMQEVENVTRNVFFHFTITGIPKDIEQNTPPVEDTINDFVYLSKRYSPDQVIWRFDPVCMTDTLSFGYFKEMFSLLAERLHGHCRTCYISFVQKYRKALRNFEKYSSHELVHIEAVMQQKYAVILGRIAQKNGINLYACCNDYLLSHAVHKGSCIKGTELIRLFGSNSLYSPPSPTRKECSCTKSIDIGAYDTCPQGCLYCYANSDREKSRATFELMDVFWNGLGFHVKEDMNLSN